jgi:hypothetical protein
MHRFIVNFTHSTVYMTDSVGHVTRWSGVLWYGARLYGVWWSFFLDLRLTSTQSIHVSLRGRSSTLETQDLSCLEETNSMTSLACSILAVSMRVAFEPGDTISASFPSELTIKLWLLGPIVLVTR